MGAVLDGDSEKQSVREATPRSWHRDRLHDYLPNEPKRKFKEEDVQVSEGRSTQYSRKK